MTADAETTWVDLTFPVSAAQGGQVASDYARRLAQGIVRILPWWSTEQNAGVHPLKGLSSCGGSLLVGGRTHLTLRIPESRVDDCAQLAGREIDLEGKIALGTPRLRALLAHPVVYSSCVASGDDDEAGFLAYAKETLESMGIESQMIVGKQSVMLTDSGSTVGFSLMIAGLSIENSLRIQQKGLGMHRSLGCGIFVPHRSINAVGL